MKKLLVIFGTRPEAIKLSPLIKTLKEKFEVLVCFTGQHPEMVFEVLSIFDIKIDIAFKRNEISRRLDLLFVDQLGNLCKNITGNDIDGVIVQGDTHSTITGGIFGRFNHLPVFHVEAGLRSGNINKPFPEEFNRRLVGLCTSLHFCPTSGSKNNLRRENIKENTFIVGNTVVDAQQFVLKKFKESKIVLKGFNNKDLILNFGKESNYFIYTGHRREALDSGNLEQVFEKIKIILFKYPKLNCFFPVHKNPKIRVLAKNFFSSVKNLFLIEPIGYADFTRTIHNAKFLITDSGGVQEEAIALSKPVLITRDVTERPEVLISGLGKLVGEDGNKLLSHVDKIMLGSSTFKSKLSKNPFGDGKTSIKILKHLLKYYKDNVS